MPVSASTNDKLRELMASAQAHRAACNVSEDAISSLHINQESPDLAAPKPSFLRSAKTAFSNLLEVFGATSIKAAPEEKQGILQEILRVEESIYYALMESLGVDWTSPVYAEDPHYTYAQKAVETGMVPPEFPHWTLRDKTGTPMALIAAKNGTLPPSFDRWGISGYGGWTAAHEAAYNGNLPADVAPEVLDWVDAFGTTVKQARAEFEALAQNDSSPKMTH